MTVEAGDWPTYRANNSATATASVELRANAKLLWDHVPKTFYTPSAPTAAGSLTFVSGSDGVIRALDVQNGKEAWLAFTGGDVRLPPTISKGRALAGSGDGWVYSLDARTGKRLWRFRAAPIERRIPIYGTLQSTWPAASGVLVDDGVAYVAAGLANYDGTTRILNIPCSILRCLTRRCSPPLAWANNAKLMCFTGVHGDRAGFQKALWGKTQSKGLTPTWEFDCPKSAAVAVCPNAVLVATPNELTALSIQDGRVLWRQTLPASPVPWGLAINREGKVIVTLEGGRVVCFG